MTGPEFQQLFILLEELEGYLATDGHVDEFDRIHYQAAIDKLKNYLDMLDRS